MKLELSPMVKAIHGTGRLSAMSFSPSLQTVSQQAPITLVRHLAAATLDHFFTVPSLPTKDSCSVTQCYPEPNIRSWSSLSSRAYGKTLRNTASQVMASLEGEERQRAKRWLFPLLYQSPAFGSELRGASYQYAILDDLKEQK
jgi:hypothetical protein